MKIKKGFVLRNVANTHIVVPLAQNRLNEHGMISLSESGARLWQALEKGSTPEALIQLLLDTYEVDHVTVEKDVTDFLAKVREIGALEE